MTTIRLAEIYKTHKEKTLLGRYITNENIETLLGNLGPKFQKTTIGFSVENKPIYSVKVGVGKIRILAWSQMHGNESTTTKALFDLFNVIKNSDEFGDILKSCTLKIIPILNPDGAKYYTRLNANKVDLNRDAQNLSQLESVVLRSVFDSFKPDFCLNLHGQRTIFGVGDSGKVATLSFLSPAEDKDRTITEARKKGMAVIAEINKVMQADLPYAIGRYDDGFNINCVGDTFQSLKVPTLLYEAGHFKNDYDRETVREYIFKSLFTGINTISKGVETTNYNNYFDIPENKKNFYDVIIRNVKLDSNSRSLVDVAFQFKEILIGNTVEFLPYVQHIGSLNMYYAHKEVDGKEAVIKNVNNKPLQLSSENVFVMLNKSKILIKP